MGKIKFYIIDEIAVAVIYFTKIYMANFQLIELLKFGVRYDLNKLKWRQMH